MLHPVDHHLWASGYMGRLPLQSRRVRPEQWLRVLGLNLLAIAAGAIYMRPTDLAIWWEEQVQLREGLGLIITTLSLLVVVYTLGDCGISRPRSLPAELANSRWIRTATANGEASWQR